VTEISSSRGVFVYIALCATVAALFTLLPAIDLWSSGWFYRSGFYLADEPVLRVIYRLVFIVTDFLAVALPLIFVAALWRRKKIFGLDYRAALFLIVALAVGPGIVVNSVLKDHWGRARPSQIEQFGGAKQFTPALEPTNQCDHNCSFPAGHPATGFYFVSFAFLISAARARRRVMAGAIVAGGLIGLVRMAQGGHFLSDVVFSGLIVFGVSWLLHDLIVRRGGISASSGGRRAALIAVVAVIAILLCYALFDRSIAIALHQVDPRVNAVFEFITQFGLGKGYLIGGAVAFIGLYLGARRVRRPALAARLKMNAWRALFLFATVAISGLLVDLLKVVFGRARPRLLFRDGEYGFTWRGGNADYWSFPSGHAATAAAVALSLTLIWPRYWPAYWLAALLVIASRVIIDAHYLSDTIAGGTIAAATVWLVLAGFTRFNLRLRESP